MLNYKSIKWGCATVLLLGLVACDAPEVLEETPLQAERDDFGADVPDDPLDGFSRAMMELNFFLDDYILQPAATVYKALTPEFVQTGVGNFTEYAKVPFYMVNDLLQWKLDRFAQNFWVFTINTFSGFGVINTAGYMDVYAKPNDFGITLHNWGGGAGFDVTLPGLGPTCFRDVVGSVVGVFINPVGIISDYYDYRGAYYSVTGLGLVHTRSNYLGQLESLRKESYDPYVTIKSIVEQKREAELKENE
jgi:phospholipid-binding lipoprotein MlaA